MPAGQAGDGEPSADGSDAAKMSPRIPTRRLETRLLKKPTMGPMKKP